MHTLISLTVQLMWWAGFCWWGPSSGDRWQPEQWPCCYKALQATPGSVWQNPLWTAEEVGQTIKLTINQWINSGFVTGYYGTKYLIVGFEKFMQDHFIDGRSETQISSGQILTDGLKLEREGAILITDWCWKKDFLKEMHHYFMSIITLVIEFY